ncbi:MAG: DNA mismatch repair endonuclease MutL [Spirochaetaceae bacterium]|jgi:DNA mismatch repair protein MutL|nr:DNA mismatch repair endonuclease MutL [Spirochaetaceae bacterium]
MMSSAIQILSPEEARKIAAGEVIDRPASFVREFIDNAIDAGGQAIELTLEEGGTRLVEVSDDGCGMGREDLEIAFKDHATSKIRSLEDLQTARTLGFRGEALAAAAAVARLEILTSADGKTGWLLSVGPGNEEACIENARRTRGSSVRARNLFETIPARKRFLKRAGSEMRVCKQVFIEKALAFPEKSFRFTQDGGKLNLFFPAVESYKERFADAVLVGGCGHERVFLHQIAAFGRGFTLTIVTGGPEIYRNHRKEQFVFANGRRIDDFSFQQALEYGTQGAFPNGCHPIGAIFLDIEPHLADFNIHPAKREARFACPGEIHHAITETLRNHFRRILEKSDRQIPYQSPAPQDGVRFSQELEHAQTEYVADKEALYGHERHDPHELLEQGGDTWLPPTSKCRYAGRAFGLFILIEKDDRLYIIDQHAAHERILYDRLLSKPIPRQELLAPIPFMTESSEDDQFLVREKEKLLRLGIVIDGGDGAWQIMALPILWRLGDAETIRALLNLRTAGENIAERWAATIACHSAIRDGDYLDNESALSLAEELLKRPMQTCPHGRPVLTEIKREDLYKAVRRS